MHNVNRLFNRKKAKDPAGLNMAKKKLQRRNAVKNIDYDAASSSSSLEDLSLSSSCSTLVTRSLELPSDTSFRIEGNGDDFIKICRSLGFTGPEDFAIPAAEWEASKIRSSSDVLPMIKSTLFESPRKSDVCKSGTCAAAGARAYDGDLYVLTPEMVDDMAEHMHGGAGLHEQIEESSKVDETFETELTKKSSAESNSELGVVVRDDGSEGRGLFTERVQPRGSPISATGGGINGLRPPVLKPPPAMRLPVINYQCSNWDLFRDFAPESERGYLIGARRQLDSSSSSGEEVEFEEEETNKKKERSTFTAEDNAVLSEECFFLTSNDDASSSTTDMSYVSPSVKQKRTITSWQKGRLLGSGSFGSVYEGIADVGFFFAIKEVSLLDQGSEAQQCIDQLEQEIDLLSQFEHENIVQYYGTDKDDEKLYIFLEFVTNGSILKLYNTYNLRDSQVSSYTRQILLGLKYLHDRDVVHRDIKSANILVDSSGSVKLVDFGLAKVTKMNDAKSFKGSPFWMAPEVVNGKNGGYGFPADIWSLGCTVLEMLTGQIPYSDFEPFQALYRIGKGIPPTVPENLSADARDFILRCLNVKPSLRPTAAELLGHSFVKRPPHTSLGTASPCRGSRN